MKVWPTTELLGVPLARGRSERSAAALSVGGGPGCGFAFGDGDGRASRDRIARMDCKIAGVGGAASGEIHESRYDGREEGPGGAAEARAWSESPKTIREESGREEIRTASEAGYENISTGGLFLLLLAQRWFPGGPADRYPTTPTTWDLALNTTISFSTTTTWHAHGGETTLRYWTQLFDWSPRISSPARPVWPWGSLSSGPLGDCGVVRSRAARRLVPYDCLPDPGAVLPARLQSWQGSQRSPRAAQNWSGLERW
jgi:hypothetical protein